MEVAVGRKKTTEFLGNLLVSDRFAGMGKYWAREVSVDYGTKDVKRGDCDGIRKLRTELNKVNC